MTDNADITQSQTAMQPISQWLSTTAMCWCLLYFTTTASCVSVCLKWCSLLLWVQPRFLILI